MSIRARSITFVVMAAREFLLKSLKSGKRVR